MGKKWIKIELIFSSTFLEKQEETQVSNNERGRYETEIPRSLHFKSMN